MQKSFYVLLSLGSNVGDKAQYLYKAISALYLGDILKNIKVSKIYETEPVGYTQQDWFLNCTVSGYTKLGFFELLKACKNIERKLGRVLRPRWHKREIDIDILLYSRLVFESEKLAIPHPRMHERKFVLVPAVEIAPNAIHPRFKTTMLNLLQNCQDKSIVRKISIPAVTFPSKLFHT